MSRIYLCFLLMLGFLAPDLRAQDAASTVQDAFVRVAERVKPAVVTIYCERPPGTDGPTPFPRELDDLETDPNAPRPSLGTGMIVRADGYVLTNYHVVRGAILIRVLLGADSEQVQRPVARLIGFDEGSDLAVVKIERENLPTVEWADSDAVKIGQWSLAIGAPFEQMQTLTAGIVSAHERIIDEGPSRGLHSYLQTDAAINPGNSGGPLLDLNGRVIGVNTAILSPSRFNVGIGFSLPANTVKALLPRLMNGQSIRRGFVGIQYVLLDEAVAKEWGVAGGLQIGAMALKNGKPTGAALEAGLREDDILLAIDGVELRSTQQFRALVSTQAPGTEIKLAIARPTISGVEKFDVTIKLGDRADQFGAPEDARAPVKTVAPTGLGMNVQDASKLTLGEKTRFKLSGREIGAVITQIAPGSPADEAGLRRGLRVVRVRVEGAWHQVPDSYAWHKIEREIVPGVRMLLQLRDADEVSVYKVVIASVAPVPVTEKGISAGA